MKLSRLGAALAIVLATAAPLALTATAASADPYNTPYYAGMLATGSGTASIGGVMQASGGGARL